jgi:uncharacterized membrane protein
MEQGWDPEVKQFFKKVMSTLFYGLFWMMGVALGLYLKLGGGQGKPLYAVMIFYALAVITLFLLLRYYYRIWKDS